MGGPLLFLLLAPLLALLLVARGEVISTAECGSQLNVSLFLNASSGTLTSGTLSSSTYVSDQICRILISPSDQSNRIMLTFTKLALESSYDFVRVYDGSVEDEDALLASFTGAVTSPPLLMSNSTTMLVVLEADGSTEDLGFTANYTEFSFIPYNCSALDDCSGHGNCTQTAVCDCHDGWLGENCDTAADCSALNDCSGTGFCYDNNLCRCEPGWVGPSCSEFASTANCTGKGSHVLQAPNGTVTDGDGEYQPNADCLFYIRPNHTNPVKIIRLRFTELDVEDGYDEVYIHEEPYDESKPLYTFTGQTVPDDVYVAMSSVVVRFTSDNGAQGEGFSLDYAVIEADCPLRNQCSGNGHCIDQDVCLCLPGFVQDDCSVAISFSNCTGTSSSPMTAVLGALNGTITDGVGFYKYYSDCTFEIRPRPEASYVVSSITLSFEVFDTQENWDFVAIYQNSANPTNLIGEYSGTELPGTLVVNASVVIIHFTATYDYDGEGFLIHYASSAFSCSGVNDCSGHGLCVATDVCACEDFFEGDDCSQELVGCQKGLCVNGTCEDLPGGAHKCHCTYGFEGVNCDQPVYFSVANYTFVNTQTWVAPPGSSVAIVSLWGCGGNGGASICCNVGPGNCALCQGMRGSSGGFTRKRVPLTPGATYSIALEQNSGEVQGSTSFKNQSGDALAWATCGRTGFGNRFCNSCQTLISTIGGNGEPLTNPGVILSLDAPTVFPPSACPDPIEVDGVSAGQGTCTASPPSSFVGTATPASGFVIGKSGLVMIQVLARLVPIASIEYEHFPDVEVKTLDMVQVRVLITDSEGLTTFSSAVASRMAQDLSIKYRDLATGQVRSLPATISQEQDSGYNFLATYRYVQSGAYEAWVTYQDQEVGGGRTSVNVLDNLVAFPTLIQNTSPLGSFYTVNVTLYNSGTSELSWNFSFVEPKPWVSFSVLPTLALGPGKMADLQLHFSIDRDSLNATLGHHEAKVRFVTPGQNNVDVTISLEAVPGPIDPLSTELALDAAGFAVNVPGVLNITTFDAYGFRRTSGGDKFVIGDQNPSPLAVGAPVLSCVDMRSGFYACILRFPGPAGNVSFSIGLQDGEEVHPVQDLTVQVHPILCGLLETPNGLGTQCVCREGYYRDEGQCLPCPSSQFKNYTGDQPCAPCPANSRSVDQTSCACVNNTVGVGDQCVCEAGFDPAAGCLDRCREGYYSLQGSDGCMTCNLTGVTCSGGYMKILKGFWWPGESFDMNQEGLKCRKEGICFVSAEEFVDPSHPPNMTCREGHDPLSPLCSVCLDGYASSGGDSVCHQCWHPAASWVVLVLLVLAIVLIAFFVVTRSGQHRSNSSVLLRIAINFIQVTFLFSKFKTNGTELFYNIFSFPTAAGNGFSIDFFPVQCALGWDYFGKWGFYMALPFAIVILPALAVFIDAKLIRKEGSKGKRTYRATVIALLFLIYSQLGTQVLSIFDCYPEEINGYRPLGASMDVACFSTPHIIGMAFGVLFGMLYIVGIPLVGVYVVYKHRKELYTDDVIRSYGFLYTGYLKSGFPVYWEFVVLARKLGLMIILVFFESGFGQNFAANLLLVSALLLQLLFMPYLHPRLNAAEAFSLLVSFLTQNLSLLLWTNGVSYKAVSIVIVVINVTFFVYLVLNIGQAIYIERVKERGLSFKDLPKHAKLLVQQMSFASSSGDLAALGVPPSISMDNLSPEKEAPEVQKRPSKRTSRFSYNRPVSMFGTRMDQGEMENQPPPFLETPEGNVY